MESEKTAKNHVFKQSNSGNDSDLDDQDEYQTESDVLLPISQDAHRLFINHDDGKIKKDFLPRIIINNHHKVNNQILLTNIRLFKKILKLLFYKFREKYYLIFCRSSQIQAKTLRNAQVL